MSVISANIIPDLRYLSEQKHQDFMAILFGLQSHKGMPPFGEILDQDQLQDIHQYIIKRSHDWRQELMEQAAADNKLTK